MEINYMALALGRGPSSERIYGMLLDFESDEIPEMRPFEERASRGIIDMVYLGPNKCDARNAIAHLKPVKGLVERVFPD